MSTTTPGTGVNDQTESKKATEAKAASDEARPVSDQLLELLYRHPDGTQRASRR